MSQHFVNRISPLAPATVVGIDALGPVPGSSTLPITSAALKGPVFNVKHPDFGAKGDNATDDSAAFQAAITTAIAWNGTVYIPAPVAGSSYIIANVQATGAGANTILRFAGDGTGSLVKLKPGSATCVFFMVGIAGVAFESLTLDGNRANCPGGLAVIRSDVSDTMVRSCKIQNGNQDAIFITPDGVGGITTATRVTVVGNHFFSCGNSGYGGVAVAAEQVSGCVVSGNVCDTMGAGLCDIEPIGAGALSDSVVIVGNTVRNTQSWGIPGAIQVTSDNASNPAGTGSNAVDHVVIASNVVNTTGTNGVGIYVQANRRTLVSGNYVYNTDQSGIFIDADVGRESKYVSVLGNVIVDPSAGAGGHDGIRLNNAQSCVISGNSCLDTRGVPLMARAIREQGTSTGNFFGPVFALGATVENITLVGTPAVTETAGPWYTQGLVRVRAQGASRYRADLNRTSTSLNINAFDETGLVFQPIVFGTNWADTVQALATTATPSVLGGNAYTVAASGTAVTDFSSATDGQEITLLFSGARTITQGATIELNGAVNFVGANKNTLTLKRFAGVWYEKGRKV